MITRSSFRTVAISAALAALLAACGDKPETLIASAKDYLAKKDTKAAVIQIKNALQQAPDLPEARYLLGKALLEGGEVTGAEVELRKALDLKYPADQVAPLLAKVMLAKGQARAVVDEFGKVEVASPEGKAELATSMSLAHAALGNQEASQTALADALAAQPDFVPALLLQARSKAVKGDFPGALAVVDKIVEKSPAAAEAWQLKGDILQAQGARDDAVAAYRRAVDARPDYLPAQAAATVGLMRQGKLDEAGSQLEAMKKVAGKHPQTLFLEAQYAFQKKDYKTARAHIQQYHQSAPTSASSLQLAGAIEFQLGAYGAAEENLSRALQNKPGLVVARRLLVATYLRTGQHAKAMAALEPVLGKIDKDAPMLSLAGETFAQQGDFKKAEEYFAKAAKLDPNDPAKRTRLAVTHLAKGDADNAFEELEGIAAGDTGTSADLALISAHLRRNEVDKALKAIDGLEKKRPDDPGVLGLRGRTLLAKKDIAGARKSFEKALALKPAYFPAAASLAAMDMADKKPEEAKRRFEAVLAADPKSIQAHLALAELRARTGGSVDEVAALVNKAIAANPTAAVPRLALIEAYLRKEPKKAVAAAQDAMAAIPDRPELVEAAGRALLAAGDINQATATFNRLAAMQPSSPVPYLRLAEAQMAAKDREGAVKSLKKGLGVTPDYLAAQEALVRIHVSAGRHQDALAVAKEVQKQRPKDGIGYLFEGDVAISRKAWDDAAKAYRAGMDRSPVTDLARRLYGALLAGGHKADADKLAATWLKEHSKDATFRLYLAESANARQDYASAAQHYRTLLESQPDNPLLLNNLAWAAVQLKDPKALEYAEKANRLSPDQPAILDTLAFVLVEKGESAKGLELYRKALKIAPQAAPIRFNLAKTLVKLGQKVEARAELEELARLGDKFPGQTEVAKLLKEI